MSQNLLRNPALTFLIGLSLFGLLLVTILAFNPPIVQESLPLRKPTIGSLFGLLCILGILAAFFPKHCSMMFEGKSKRLDEENFPSHVTLHTLQGHHPQCQGFSAHVFEVKNKVLCIACTGLFLGGLSALAGTILYFFGDLRFETNSPLVVCGGVLGVGFGLFQFKVKKRYVRLFLNASFVLGAFLVLVGIDELVKSLFVDLFLVSLSVFWLFTRILLSQWDHWRTCNTCESVCEICKNGKKDQHLRLSP